MKKGALLFVSILVGITLLGNTVLCTGYDGHQALEKSGLTGCGNRAAAPLNPADTFSNDRGIEQGHCGPCVDVSISANYSGRQVLSFQSDFPPETAPFDADHVASSFSSIRIGAGASFPPIVSSTMAHLNTTILLI